MFFGGLTSSFKKTKKTKKYLPLICEICKRTFPTSVDKKVSALREKSLF